jgi:inosine/xanthosine triphosphatase
MVVGVEVASGVLSQPMSEEETRQGALNRAKASLTIADFGVGIEGGVQEVGDKLFECAWVAVVSAKGEVGLGGGLYFELPEKIANRIRAGEELGPIMQELMQYDVKRNDGAIGVLTKGMLTRQGAYEQIVKSAIVRFVSREWF